MPYHRISSRTLPRNFRKKHAKKPNIFHGFFVKSGRSTKRFLTNWSFFARQKIHKSIVFKMLRGKKIPLYQVPLATVKVTLHALKWIFLLVLLYLTVGFIILLVQDGMRSVRDIIIYGITGFVTFFMGYFGWLFARDVIRVVTGQKVRNEDPEL